MSPTIPKALQQQAYLRQIGSKYKGQCKTRWCRQAINPFTYHVICNQPVSKGGQVHLDNCIVVCKTCYEICSKTELAFYEHQNSKIATPNCCLIC